MAESLKETIIFDDDVLYTRTHFLLPSLVGYVVGCFG